MHTVRARPNAHARSLSSVHFFANTSPTVYPQPITTARNEKISNNRKKQNINVSVRLNAMKKSRDCTSSKKWWNKRTRKKRSCEQKKTRTSIHMYGFGDNVKPFCNFIHWHKSTTTCSTCGKSDRERERERLAEWAKSRHNSAKWSSWCKQHHHINRIIETIKKLKRKETHHRLSLPCFLYSSKFIFNANALAFVSTWFRFGDCGLSSAFAFCCFVLRFTSSAASANNVCFSCDYD